jgi:Cu(I)/Ag(I) efflux system membrane protein CusA/SilA
VNHPEGQGSEFPRLSSEEIWEAVYTGTSKRVRPVAMTATSTIAGLLPVMWASGTGSDVMQRVAAPMVGGMFTTLILCLLVLPVIYGLVLQLKENHFQFN